MIVSGPARSVHVAGARSFSSPRVSGDSVRPDPARASHVFVAPHPKKTLTRWLNSVKAAKDLQLAYADVL